MAKVDLCVVLKKWWHLHQRMEKDGGRDGSLKMAYYTTQNKFYGLRVRGVYSGYEYEVIGVAPCDGDEPAFEVRRLDDGHVGCVSCGLLEPVHSPTPRAADAGEPPQPEAEDGDEPGASQGHGRPPRR